MDGTADPQRDPCTGEEGGDPACWLKRVCSACGRLADEDPPTRCAACGAEVTEDGPREGPGGRPVLRFR